MRKHMSYRNPRIAKTADLLKKRLEEAADKAGVLRAVELKALFDLAYAKYNPSGWLSGI